jgi:hypothetical protein
MSESTIAPSSSGPASPAGSPVEVRWARVALAFVLPLSTIALIPVLIWLKPDIPAKADVYIGLLVGFQISKSGTVIDWLFGGSESGTRRTDQLISAATPPPGGALVIADKPSDVTLSDKAP